MAAARVRAFFPFNTAAFVGSDWTAFTAGSFAHAIAMDRRLSPVRLLQNHDERVVLARRSEGRLGLTEIPSGLYLEATVDGDYAEALLRMSQLKQVHGISPGWREDSRAEWRGRTRWITDCDLVELSLMTGDGRPAFSSTSVEIIEDDD